MTIQLSKRIDRVFNFPAEESIRHYGLEWKKEKDYSGYLLLHVIEGSGKERDVYRCMSADTAVTRISPFAYERFVRSMLSPLGELRVLFGKDRDEGMLPVVTLINEGEGSKNIRSILLADCLVDTFHRLAYGPLDEEEIITCARVYAAGRLKVKEFKDCSTIEIVPYPHKSPFVGFKIVLRDKVKGVADFNDYDADDFVPDSDSESSISDLEGEELTTPYQLLW